MELQVQRIKICTHFMRLIEVGIADQTNFKPTRDQLQLADASQKSPFEEADEDCEQSQITMLKSIRTYDTEILKGRH